MGLFFLIILSKLQIPKKVIYLINLIFLFDYLLTSIYINLLDYLKLYAEVLLYYYYKTFTRK